MTHLLLFRVRSWKNGMRCMCSYILMHKWLHSTENFGYNYIIYMISSGSRTLLVYNECHLSWTLSILNSYPSLLLTWLGLLLLIITNSSIQLFHSVWISLILILRSYHPFQLMADEWQMSLQNNKKTHKHLKTDVSALWPLMVWHRWNISN